jgi:hypothetical protein
MLRQITSIMPASQYQTPRATDGQEAVKKLVSKAADEFQNDLKEKARL